MLACARRRVPSVLPRPFAFSTATAPRLDEKDSSPLANLSEMLFITGDRVAPIIPSGSGMTGMSHSDQTHNNSFRTNRVVTPADLTYQTRTYQLRRRKRENVAPRSSVCRYNDPFYQLDMDPRDFTTNPVVLSEYLSEMGKIHGRTQTRLTAKNQRLLSKTIRRAKMMGIIPHLSLFPWVENRVRRR